MLERVAESMTSEIELRLLARDAGGEHLVFEGTGRHACLEAQGDPRADRGSLRAEPQGPRRWSSAGRPVEPSSNSDWDSRYTPVHSDVPP